MGITCAPQIWMNYITLILGELEEKSRYIAIMDDLLVHSSKAAHWRLLEQLFKSMCKNGPRLMRHSIACIYIDIQNVELRSLLTFSWNKW